MTLQAVITVRKSDDAGDAVEDNNNNNKNNKNREVIERFQTLRALYNLKKTIQCTNTQNYTNQ